MSGGPWRTHAVCGFTVTTPEADCPMCAKAREVREGLWQEALEALELAEFSLSALFPSGLKTLEGDALPDHPALVKVRAVLEKAKTAERH